MNDKYQIQLERIQNFPEKLNPNSSFSLSSYSVFMSPSIHLNYLTEIFNSSRAAETLDLHNMSETFKIQLEPWAARRSVCVIVRYTHRRTHTHTQTSAP